MPEQTTGNQAWTIFGAGAQGLLIYAYGQRATLPWSLLVRTGTTLPTQMQYERDAQISLLPLHAMDVAQAPKRSVSHVLLCVKAWALPEALKSLQMLLQTHATVLICANGVGWLQAAQQQLTDCLVMPVVSTHGSFRRSPWHVVDTGYRGSFWLGSTNAVASAKRDTLLQSLQSSQLDVHWDEQIEQRMWRKAAINACINPLTALLNCRNGELLAHHGAQTRLPLLYQECAQVLSTVSIVLSAEELAAQVAQVCAITANNYSSMHDDWRHGRRTEIDAINGSLLQQGEQNGLLLPQLRELWQQISSTTPTDA